MVQMYIEKNKIISQEEESKAWIYKIQIMFVEYFNFDLIDLDHLSQ